VNVQRKAEAGAMVLRTHPAFGAVLAVPLPDGGEECTPGANAPGVPVAAGLGDSGGGLGE
jgi:hypothetical protein